MENKKFLHDLIATPSPSGSEQAIQRIIRDYMKKYADSIETDLHGNLIVGINTKASRRVMLAGHCDQIGLMVKHISNEGFLYVAAIGGVDVGVLHGSRIVVHTAKGAIRGVVGRKPIHMQSGDERDRTRNDLEKMWVDIGAKNRQEASRLVSLGDPITFELDVVELGNSNFSAAGLDDKVGVFVAMETLRACSAGKLDVALYAVSTVQEELGIRGSTTSAFSIEPEVGIAIDVFHATDNPGHENSKSTRIHLGSGPTIVKGPSVNPVVGQLLQQAAKKTRTKFQLSPAAKLAGNDARSIQVTRNGVATGVVEIPNRYMHSPVETCNYKDIQGAIKILTSFVQSISKKTDFRPV